MRPWGGAKRPGGAGEIGAATTREIGAWWMADRGWGGATRKEGGWGRVRGRRRAEGEVLEAAEWGRILGRRAAASGEGGFREGRTTVGGEGGWGDTRMATGGGGGWDRSGASIDLDQAREGTNLWG